ncbi:MAG: phosphonate ABC transporter, permease protein PhnE [Oscillospiraceae bacterium]|nr:phosphonate ABC transporter, permease protein PhnE [Oscillospiraceae bacterium]
MISRIFKPKIITLPNGKEVKQPRSMLPLVVVVFLVFTYFSIQLTGFNLTVLITRINHFFFILGEMIPPRFAYMNRVWDPLLDTLKMSLLGSAIGAALAFPAAILAASNIVKSKIIVHLTRLILSAVRTLPTLIVALIATFVLGLGTLAGTVAIAVFTFAYIGKQLYEIIETVDMGAYEAMEAIGIKKIPAFWLAIAPQIMPVYISTALFCLEGNVRHAAILGWVGAGGIGLILNQRIQFRDYSAVGMILLALLITVTLIEALSHFIRRRLT